MNRKLWWMSAPVLAGVCLAVSSGLQAEVKSYATADSNQVADGGKSDGAAANSDLDAQLASARARLDAAAREVAELSTRLSRPLADKFHGFGDGPGRVVIGVQLDPESATDGAHIVEVSPGGPAAEAGLQLQDVIVAINGKEIKGEETARQIQRAMLDVAPESKVKLRVLRDGRAREFVVTARPGMGVFGMRVPHPPGPHEFPDPHSDEFPFERHFMIAPPLAEMELASLTPQLGRYFGTEKGVLVVRAPRSGELKLEDGDVILAIDGREPTSGSHATRILGSYQPGEKVALKLMRQHKALTVDATLPEHRRLPGPGVAGPGPGPVPGPGPGPHRGGGPGPASPPHQDESPT